MKKSRYIVADTKDYIDCPYTTLHTSSVLDNSLICL
jgi:hypothetical protein